MREYITLIAVRILGRFISVRILPIVRIMRLPVRELLYVREILPVRVHRLLLVRARQPDLEQRHVPGQQRVPAVLLVPEHRNVLVLHRVPAILHAPAVLHVPERQQVLVPEQNIDHQLLPDRRLRPGMKNRIKRLSLIETITEAREVPIVDRKRIQAHLAQVVDQQVEVRLLQVPIVKADVQIVVQREALADEVKVVPLVEAAVPKEPIVLPVGEPVVQAVAVAPVPAGVTVIPVLLEAAVVQVLPEAIVAPAGVMFPVDKQKNVLLQEVREAVTVALPVHLKEVTVQEDNLFLYY